MSRLRTDVQGTLEQRGGARCCRSVLQTHILIQPTHFTSYILLPDPSLAIVSPKTAEKRPNLNENLPLHIRVLSGAGDYPTSDPMADTIPTGPARPAIGCPLDSRGEATLWFGTDSADVTLRAFKGPRASAGRNPCFIIKCLLGLRGEAKVWFGTKSGRGCSGNTGYLK